MLLRALSQTLLLDRRALCTAGRCASAEEHCSFRDYSPSKLLYKFARPVPNDLAQKRTHTHMHLLILRTSSEILWYSSVCSSSVKSSSSVFSATNPIQPNWTSRHFTTQRCCFGTRGQHQPCFPALWSVMPVFHHLPCILRNEVHETRQMPSRNFCTRLSFLAFIVRFCTTSLS